MAKRRPNKSHKPFYGPGRPRGLTRRTISPWPAWSGTAKRPGRNWRRRAWRCLRDRKSDFRRFVEKELGSK